MPSGYVDRTKPLRPLTEFAWKVLSILSRGPLPRQDINSGVNERLEREGLSVVELMPSPYGRPGGPKISYAVITDKGREKLRERPR